MRIIHVLESFFPDSRAGTEQYILWLSKYLQNAGHEIFIVAATTTKASEYNYSGIPVYRFLVPHNPIKKELNGLIPPRGIQGFELILTSLRPDIVHFHSFNRKINYYHLIVAKKNGCRTVFTSHLAGIFCLKGSLLLFNKTPCDGEVKKLRCFACFLHNKGVSKPFAQLLSGATYLPKKIKEIFPVLNMVDYRKKDLSTMNELCEVVIALTPWAKNCYEINNVTNSRLVLQGTEKQPQKNAFAKKDKISIGFIGRMYPIKGLHLLLDALNSMNNSSFTLKIIYIPSDSEYLNQIIEKISHLCNPGLMVSDQSPEEVEKHLEQIDLLCLPSTVAEMAPLVILEAFAKGIPVIGSNHGGIKDMIKHEIDGLLFENNNVQSLQKVLQRFIDEPDLLPNLQKNISTPRNFTDVGSEIEKIYKNINI